MERETLSFPGMGYQDMHKVSGLRFVTFAFTMHTFWGVREYMFSQVGVHAFKVRAICFRR